jgi:hypothetical protein
MENCVADGIRRWIGESENPLPPLPDYIEDPDTAFVMADGKPMKPTTSYWLWAWRTYAELADA